MGVWGIKSYTLKNATFLGGTLRVSGNLHVKQVDRVPLADVV